LGGRNANLGDLGRVAQAPAPAPGVLNGCQYKKGRGRRGKRLEDRVCHRVCGWRGFLSLRRIGPCTCRVRSSGTDDSTNRCQRRERSDDPRNPIAMGILPCRLVERGATATGKECEGHGGCFPFCLLVMWEKHGTHALESPDWLPSSCWPAAPHQIRP
jgi:hypothetical protein